MTKNISSRRRRGIDGGSHPGKYAEPNAASQTARTPSVREAGLPAQGVQPAHLPALPVAGNTVVMRQAVGSVEMTREWFASTFDSTQRTTHHGGASAEALGNLKFEKTRTSLPFSPATSTKNGGHLSNSSNGIPLSQPTQEPDNRRHTHISATSSPATIRNHPYDQSQPTDQPMNITGQASPT